MAELDPMSQPDAAAYAEAHQVATEVLAWRKAFTEVGLEMWTADDFYRFMRVDVKRKGNDGG